VQFALDETAQAVVQAAAAILDGADGVGPAGAADAAAVERTWKALGHAGLLSLSVPTRLGGEGLGALASMTLLTEIGRRGAALPVLATVALGVLPLVRWGTPDQQDDLLAGRGEGLGGPAAAPPVLTAALREPTDPEPTVPATTCGPAGELTGTKVGVPYADRAKRILVPVSLTSVGSGGPGAAPPTGRGRDHGPRRRGRANRTAVALVDPAAPGVTLTRTPSSSETPEWTVRLDGAVATGVLRGGAEAVEDVYRLALAGACALGDGAVAGALALTSAHVRDREQFGRPLATFQAVAQQIADVYIAARTLHLATLSACWRLDRALLMSPGGPGAAEGAAAGIEAPRRDLDVAGYWLAREAPAALRTCHHLHGGLGLDITYPLHRYSALVADVVRSVGGAEYRLDALGRAEAVGGPGVVASGRAGGEVA
jgi:alkylation response protein AidB-like acyl-CoA dehydrogenase